MAIFFALFPAWCDVKFVVKKSLLSSLAAQTALLASGVVATSAPNAAEIDNLQVCFAVCTAPRCEKRLVSLRHFERDGQPAALVVDPDTLDTAVRPLSSLPSSCSSWPEVRAEIAGSRYEKAVLDAERNALELQNAGIVHSLPVGNGVVLTLDLCPSRHPLDRGLIERVIAEFKPVERPVPLAVAVTGVWMEEHPDDLAWLLELTQRGDAAITWINHSFHHRFDPTRPLTRNFLLEPGTNLESEILRTEQTMLEHRMQPSVFFRFPGLVSNAQIFQDVVGHGLVPVGSDAWLAKGQWPINGSIVLIHGNGNEPLGVEEFLQLLRTERASIHDRNWLLLDLRDDVAAKITPCGRVGCWVKAE